MRSVAVALLCLLTTVSNAATVVVTGFGSNSAEALANAKSLALGQLASTFVTGHRVVEDGQLRERIDEYVGGVLRDYEVLALEEDQGLIKLTIRADVDTDKTNARHAAPGAEMPSGSSGELARSLDEYERIGQMVTVLDDRANAFSVTVDRLGYRMQGEVTDVDVAYHIAWQPKWLDDVRSFARTIGREREVDRDEGFLWVIAALSAAFNPMLPGTLFSVARQADGKPKLSSEPAACFGSKAWTNIESCHEIRVPFRQVTRSMSLRIMARLVFDEYERNVDLGSVNTGGYLFRLVPEGRKVYFERIGYRTFSNPSVLFFADGQAALRQSLRLRTEEAKSLLRIELNAL